MVVQLPDADWQKQLGTLEHLIVDNGILERNLTEIDLRSPTQYFFILKNGSQRTSTGERTLMGETVRLRAVGEVPAFRPGLVTALDIGSSKIACLIGRAEHGSLRILGAALRESQGIRGGHGRQPRSGRGVDPRLRRGRRRTTPTRASRTS